jgi:hypothetical protein
LLFLADYFRYSRARIVVVRDHQTTALEQERRRERVTENTVNLLEQSALLFEAISRKRASALSLYRLVSRAGRAA